MNSSNKRFILCEWIFALIWNVNSNVQPQQRSLFRVGSQWLGQSSEHYDLSQWLVGFESRAKQLWRCNVQTEVENSRTANSHFHWKTNATLFGKWVCQWYLRPNVRPKRVRLLILQWLQWHETFGTSATFAYKTVSYFALVVHGKHPSLVKTGQLNQGCCDI